MATILQSHGSGDHASRPAGNTVPDGSLYSCSTHSLIYVSDYAGNSWATWATLTGTGLSDPMTARGDIIVRNASNVTAALALGAAKRVLTSDGTDVAWTAPAANLWKMSRATSQTLTSNTLTTITFDRSDIDGGGSVIDTANNRFVAPATGFYMAYMTWLWETTPPQTSAYLSVRVGGAEAAPLCRLPGMTAATAVWDANQGFNANFPLSLTAGDFVTGHIFPGGAVTPTARGNASVHLSTSLTLVRTT